MLTGEMIKLFRICLGWKQSELAKEANVNQTLISKIELGERQISPELSKQLRTFFHLQGISDSDLLMISSTLKQARKNKKGVE
ncbi:helix-turn-helix domain-containing protein [Priestia megaterium]|uniref:helix-turn-helix domain-containing protein n=1 Tax=Priestia megaterium TaxID=1404 RepID=UPI0022826BB9|nr:helix-turn-helix transcriptional regulator [Priestia megaterium]MCY9019691.1 helix-turn-helix domain-containing protein [Priestia megaterium]